MPQSRTMSIATRTDAPSPASARADSHDLIRVQGARVNNLKDISVELPKRRLTVFTGVSGSGKSSRCEGIGTVSDIDLTQLYDDTKSIAEGAITIPGYKVDSWWTVGIFTASGFIAPNKPIRDFTKKELDDFLYKEPTKVKVNGVNLTYEGLVPKVQKSFLSKDPDGLQPHIRAFVDRAATFTACPECNGTRLSKAARSSRLGGGDNAGAPPVPK